MHVQFKEMKSRNPKLARVIDVVMAVSIILAVLWLVENLPACVRYVIQKFSD